MTVLTGLVIVFKKERNYSYDVTRLFGFSETF